MQDGKWLVLIIVFGIIIRLIFVNIPGFSIDVNDFFVWAIKFQQLGFNFYHAVSFSDYPPGALYILGLLGYLRLLLNLDNQSFFVLLKYPSILSEMILTVLIFREFRKNHSLRLSLALAAALFLNPAFFFNSTIWGQLDALLTLPIYLSVYLLSKQKLISSSIFLGLSILIKPQALALAPIFFFYSIQNSIRKFFYLAIPAIVIIVLLSFPFYPDGVLKGLSNLFLNLSNEYPYNSLYAFNFWGIQGFWVKDSFSWIFLSWQHWGYLIYGVYICLIGFFYFKKKLSLFNFATLALLAFFFLPTRVHERYLFPGLFFLVISAFQLKNRSLIILSLILSLIHLLDLYYVYVNNNLAFRLPNPLLNHSLFNSITQYGSLLSGISTVIFIWISILFLVNETPD